jgi:two-component system, chemotaxis family, protein-glutamate methylesterase/glutaminase
MVRVVVVEDSLTVREFLVHILSSDPEIEIVATAGTGVAALEAVKRTRPDVITMDVHMPTMSGLDATRIIMQTQPTPIVIVSGALDVVETASVFRAFEAGALAVLPKPFGLEHSEYEQSAAALVQTVKLMSEVKVVRRRLPLPRGEAFAAARLPAAPLTAEPQRRSAGTEVQLVAIGASTGGPPVLQRILSAMPKDFPLPVLIVQHIALGFTQGFVEWLAQSSNLPVESPTHGQRVSPGRVFVAPDGLHMTVGADGRIALTSDAPENGLRPSVSRLFRSVAKAYRRRAIGVLLTGMGKDGALELKLMKEQGAVTIAQDEDSSVVHGMPGEAIRLGGATYVLSPEKIAMTLASLAAAAGGERQTEMSVHETL